jgi:hypothetical protein
LTALEPHLVETACTGFLALVATARGLAETGTDAPTDTAARTLGTLGGLDFVEIHHSTRTR